MIDISTVVTSVLTSAGVTVGGAWWLGKALVSHRLAKDMQDYKAQWQRELESEKLRLAGDVKKQVETVLGDRAADREYELEARKRLYQSIGPLKFQLLIASRDAASRIEGHAVRQYDTNLGGYYGRSTLYRLLRPLAIAELIEREVAYADFGVDASAVELLCFKKSAHAAFTQGNVVLDHPHINWNDEEQHVFADTLSLAANSIIAKKSDGKARILQYAEFCDSLTRQPVKDGVRALAGILDDFEIKSKPLFWVRLIAFGHICREYVGGAGAPLGFDYSPLDLQALIRLSKDAHIQQNIEAFEAAIKGSVLKKL